MIKIEVTGNSIPEVADKLLAIGASLQGITTTMPAEVAEAASTPKPKASSTKSSTLVGITANGQPIETNVLEAAAPVHPTPAPKSATPVDVTESQPTTKEASSTTAPAASVIEDEELEVVDLPVSTLDFETVVRPLILEVVDKRGKPFMEDILSSFGVVKASHIKPARLPELIDLCNKALAK